MPDTKWTIYEMGMPGLHLTLNPQKPLPAEAQINRHFVNHGLTLSSWELQTILQSRTAGIATLNNIMARVLPGFSPAKRLSYSTDIADALMNKSIAAQLSREAPNTLDRLQQSDDMLQDFLLRAPPPGATRAPPPSLLERMPVGVSLTIHF